MGEAVSNDRTRSSRASGWRRVRLTVLFVILAALLGAFAWSWLMRFTPPGPAERAKAIGSTDGLPEVLRRAFDPGADFEPVPPPRPGDWLAEHEEPGQTTDEFVRSNPNRPEGERRRIYLLPLGAFPAETSPPLAQLRDFAEAFFQLEVAVLEPLDLSGSGITTRLNRSSRSLQLLTTDVLELLKEQVPADAFCLLGITMIDLYPQPSWNFVFGQASLRDRVGIYSFARYDPRFYEEEITDETAGLMLRRSCKVLAHETGHMFGILHCIHFRCLMNGSNHLAESDDRPLHLCPLDLRKLHHSVGFDVVERYRELRDFCRAAGFADEVAWLSGRLSWLERGPGRPGGREAGRPITPDG